MLLRGRGFAGAPAAEPGAPLPLPRPAASARHWLPQPRSPRRRRVLPGWPSPALPPWAARPLRTSLKFLMKPELFFPPTVVPGRRTAGGPAHVPGPAARASRFLDRRGVLLARIPLGQDFVLILLGFSPLIWVRPTQLKLWQSLLSHEFIL